MWLELFIVAGLILLNGFFACAELAIVNTRRSRIKQLAEEGDPRARLIQGFQEIRRLALLNVGLQAVGMPIVFVCVSAFGLVGAALGGVVFTTVTLAVSLFVANGVLRARGLRLRPRRDREWTTRLFRFSSPIVLSMLLTRPALLAVQTILALWLSFNDLGDYRVATSLYRVVLVLPAVISVSLLPAIAEAYATQTQERTRTQLTLLLRITTVLSLPLALLMGLGSQLWISVLFGTKYGGAALVLFVLSFAALIDTLSGICENTLIGTGRTWRVLRLNLFQVAVLVGGTILLVPAFGVLGAAYAMVLSSLAYFVGAALELARGHEVRGKDLRDVAITCIVACGAAALLVGSLGLGSYLLAAALLVTTGVALLLLLTPRDRALLLSAIRGALGTSARDSSR